MHRGSRKFFAVWVVLFGIATAVPCWAYIPDVGPGKCLSDNCDDTYTPPSYSSDSSNSYSSSSSGSGSSYNSYDAMAMNTAVGLMGSFMSAVMGGMEQAAAQQAEYDRQMVEQRRIEAELARQEQERLRAEKIANQQILRSEYQAKMVNSSASIRAGIARIETMLGLNLSSDASPLKLETLDDANPGGIDWDGRQGGTAASAKPLELMRDDFVDSNVVDLRDKTDLMVRPEAVSGQPQYKEPPAPAEQPAAETPAPKPPVAEQPVAEAPEAVPSQPEIPAAQPAAETPVPPAEELTEHPAAFRQSLPDGSQGLVEAPKEVAGAEPFAPMIPWRAVPVQNSQVDPAVLKGDTPPIRPETVETLKQDRAMMENFNRKSEERVEELRAESQMQPVREAAEKDLQEKAAQWRKRQVLEKEMAVQEEEDLKKYPGLGEALDGARKEWAEAEKEYNDLKAKGQIIPEEDLSLFLLEMNQTRPWPGPRNPEPPLASPVESDGAHFAGVMKIWRQKREAKINPAFLPSEKDNELLLKTMLEEMEAKRAKKN